MRVLTGLVLALPGYILTAAGCAAAIGASIFTAGDPQWIWPRGLLVMTASALTGVIGFFMVASADIPTGARHYQLPRHRIAVAVGYEIAVLALCTPTASAVFGTVSASTRPHVP